MTHEDVLDAVEAKMAELMEVIGLAEANGFSVIFRRDRSGRIEYSVSKSGSIPPYPSGIRVMSPDGSTAPLHA